MSGQGSRTLSAFAVATALAATLAACGGSDKDDGPPRSETVASANRLCKAANAKVAKDSIDVNTTNPVVFLAGSETRYKIVKPMYGQMLKVKPAAHDEARWSAFIAAQRKAIAAMDDMRTLARTTPTGSGDQTRAKFQANVTTILDTGDVVGETGFDYGAFECEHGPYIRHVNKPTGLPPAGALTKHFISKEIGVAFNYPKGWHEKEVTGESSSSSVAFGDDTNNCGVIVTKRSAPGGKASNSAAATTYARGQVAQGRKAADKYALVRVGPESAGNVDGAALVRRFTKDGTEYGGHIAFFFKNGKRNAIDCIAVDGAGFDKVDRDQFEPLIASFRTL
jgi:hypothetical protein